MPNALSRRPGVYGAAVLGAVALFASGIVRGETPVPDAEIRAHFVGQAAVPDALPVGYGAYEFRADGSFHRQQDIVSLFGRYVVTDGKICVEPAASDPHGERFCLAVLRHGDQYFLRAEPDGAAFAVTLHPLGATGAK
jgi:hypothetical protein